MRWKNVHVNASTAGYFRQPLTGIGTAGENMTKMYARKRSTVW